MGLIDFVKGAGAKIFGKDEEEVKQQEAKLPTPEEVKRYHDRRKAARLVREIETYNFKVENLEVKVDDDVATVSGGVYSREDREKIVLVCGNTEGIAQVDDRLEIISSEPEATYYTVTSGDTLSKIAKTHYGDAMKYHQIFEANKPMLSHPDKIYPGQVLRIPPLAD